MFTVLSNTRKSNLYLIAALAIVAVIMLSFAVVPAISAPEAALVPLSAGISAAGSDYYQRHPELRIPGAIMIDTTTDFFMRHPEWAANVQNAAIPVTGISGASDYYQRQAELKAAAGTGDSVNLADDFHQRHPEWANTMQNIGVPVSGVSESLDYFQRHSELSMPAAAGPTIDMTDYFMRHPELQVSQPSTDLSDYFFRH